MSRAVSCLLSDLPAMCGAGENVGEEAPGVSRKREQPKLGWSRGSGDVEEEEEGEQLLFILALLAMRVKGKKAVGGQFNELLVVRYLVTF